MKINTVSDDAFILSRVNYGETDRILNVLCARHGKLSVIAKGVRAGKSKLAGGIELFAENELVLLKGKGDLYIVTSSRMKNYYGDIVKDLEASSYAYECLKMINKLVPEGSGEEYYEPLLNMMTALNQNKIPLQQVKTWFGLKVLKNLGSLPNFMKDSAGRGLAEGSSFEYDFDKNYFFAKSNGTYNSGHIKILRHLSKTDKPVEIKTKDIRLIDTTADLVALLLLPHLS